MKLEKWALVAEIVSGFAIVVTLVVLITQTMANTDATRAANRQSLAGRAEELLYLQTDPVVARVLAKVNNESSLDDEESIIYFGWLHGRLRNAEEAYLQYREGNLSESYWETRLFAANASLRTPYAREVLYEAFDAYTPEFRDVLEATLAEAYEE